MNPKLFIFSAFCCIPYYFKYEHRKPKTRETVILAVMISLTILSRMMFAFTPGFKPVFAMVIICGMCFGAESGFLCGSMSAFLSNFFFGQGPWTPFQMAATGLIGAFAGYLNKRKWLEKYKYVLFLFALFCGIFYSMFMDIWTCTGYGDSFLWSRYIATCITSIPTTITYCVSNIIFLLILTPVLLKKLNRVKYKYGLVKSLKELEGEY